MPFLRLAIIFAFFAFSFARAACPDFEIFANGTSLGCNADVSKNVMYGNPLVFSISPTTGDIKWRATTDIIIVAGPVYTPILENIYKTIQYIVERDGIQKTINVNVQVRPRYTVSFETDGGTPTDIPQQSVLKDSLAKRPTETLTKAGYDFEDWNFDFSTPITEDTTIMAKWKIKTYTVSFNSDGGSSVPSQKVKYNEMAIEPTPPPTKTGYDFDGWSFDFNTPITDNMTIKAKWNIQVYKVSFDSDGGSPVPEIQNVPYGSKVTSPTPPTKADYDLEGWLLNGSKYNFSTQVTKNIDLIASWIPHPYSITYNIYEGTCASCPASYTIESPLITLPAPTKTGYEFKGWFNDQSFSIAASTIPAGSTGDKTFYAKWDIITYNITYTPNGGTMITTSPPASYNINSPTITLPTFNERCGYKFDGWFDNSGFSGTEIKTIPSGSTGNKTLYAKWTNTPDTPKKEMLSYSLPSNKNYDASPIASIIVSSTSTCPMGAITTLYNDATEPPKNAGTYQVYASISQNENYTAAKISLGSITINKASVTFNFTATVNDKEYDATTVATIKSIDFTPTSALYGTDKLDTSDYSVVSADFDKPDAGTHKINLNVIWLNGPLSQNYNLTKIIAPISATITKATNIILKIEAKNYELSDPSLPNITISKSDYINNSDVKIEYKREEDALYVPMKRPDRIGNWNVRATVNGNANYEGKTAEASFVVTRGNATRIDHNIDFTSLGFDLDDTLSNKNEYRRYYVANPKLCKIKSDSTTKIKITINEPDIAVPRINNILLDKDSILENVYYYKHTFVKSGLDTIIYKLLSQDGVYEESDTILIETPIPFKSIVGQKWNNVLFVNNNKITSGYYEFTDFNWFINNSEIGNYSQYYSAGPSSADTLNPNDIYKVVMHTAEGIRISTCESKEIEVPTQPLKKRIKTTKQVLGIKEKSLNSSSKIYNLNGKLTKEIPAGVYIVEE